MNKWEEEDLIRHEAKEEGLAEGYAKELIDLVRENLLDAKIVAKCQN